MGTTEILSVVIGEKPKELTGREKSLLEAFSSPYFLEKIIKAGSSEQNFEIWDRQSPKARWQGNFRNIDFRDTITDITSLPQFKMGRPLLAIVALRSYQPGGPLRPTTEDLFKLANVNARTKMSRNTLLILGNVSNPNEIELLILKGLQDPLKKYHVEIISKELRKEETPQGVLEVLKDYYQADYFKVPITSPQNNGHLGLALNDLVTKRVFAFA